MKYYKETLLKDLQEHGEELKGYIPQKKALEVSGLSFGALKKWQNAGAIKTKEFSGAIWVNEKDLQDHLKELQERREARKEFLKLGFVLYAKEAEFLKGLIEGHATKAEKEAFANLSAKLETHIKKIKRERKKRE